jgi:uridylate kinase
VYDSDPVKNPDAKKYTNISFSEVLEKELAIMDLTAITLCKENKMPILVLDITKEGNLYNALSNNDIGTTIS